MDIQSKLALMKALWNELQDELFQKYDGNEKMESASDDITFALYELSTIKN